LSIVHSKRRRIPRRRFHALRIDTLLVLALVAALASAFPSAAELRASRPRATPPPAIDLRLAPSEPSGLLTFEPSNLFSPTVFAFGSDGFLPSDDSVPEQEAAAAARRPWAPPGHAASADEPLPVPLPESALAARLAPSPRPVSGRRRAPASAAPAAPAPVRPSGEMTLFYDPGAALPTVVVDAPGLAPSEIPALEARAFAMRLPPAETSRVVRVPVP
jgi:hypothetical protein